MQHVRTIHILGLAFLFKAVNARKQIVKVGSRVKKTGQTGKTRNKGREASMILARLKKICSWSTSCWFNNFEKPISLNYRAFKLVSNLPKQLIQLFQCTHLEFRLGQDCILAG